MGENESTLEPQLGGQYVDTNTGVVGKCVGLYQRLNATQRVELAVVDASGRPLEWWVEQGSLAAAPATDSVAEDGNVPNQSGGGGIGGEI